MEATGCLKAASRAARAASQPACLAASRAARRLHFGSVWNRQCLFSPSIIVDFIFVVDSYTVFLFVVLPLYFCICFKFFIRFSRFWDFAKCGWFRNLNLRNSSDKWPASQSVNNSVREPDSQHTFCWRRAARWLHFRRFCNRQSLFWPSKIVDFIFVVDNHIVCIHFLYFFYTCLLDFLRVCSRRTSLPGLPYAPRPQRRHSLPSRSFC